METKVQNLCAFRTPPSYLTEDGEEEAFWVENDPIDKKWLIREKQAMQYCDLPAREQNKWLKLYHDDTENRLYIENTIGIKGFWEGFEKWWKCVMGGLDNTPDLKEGKLTPDAFNNSCTTRCEHCGLLCGKKTGIRDYEVKTIRLVVQGNSTKMAADMIPLSIGGTKSRIEKIKRKIGAKNIAELTAKTVEMGI